MKNSFYKAVLCFWGAMMINGGAEAQLSAVVTPTATTCGHDNGSAVVTPSGGSGYTYQWSAGGSTTNTTSNLASGAYTVTVYSTPATDSVVEPFNIGASTGVLAQLITDSMPRCGKSNGVIDCATNDSHALNTFLYNGSVIESGAGTQLHNADTGTYFFYAVDSTSGCSDTIGPFVLTDTTSYPIFSSVAVTGDSCFGNNNGSINVTVGDCGGGCIYSWAHIPGNTTTSAGNLPAGLDTFYVSEGGCTNLDTIINVPGPLAPIVDTLSVHPDHCGHDIGTAMANVSGGTPPFSYVWSMGTPTAAGDSVNQLVGDSTVMVTITDSHGCTHTDSGYVGSTPGPSGTVSTPDTVCFADASGVMQVTSVSGNGPFTYHWSNGVTTQVDAGVPFGSYTVTITDAVGCDTVLTDQVIAYSASIGVSAVTGFTVSAGQTVEIQLSTDVPFTNITWEPYIQGSTGQTDVSFVPQQSQTYTVVVYYGQNCSVSDTFEVGIDSSAQGVKFDIPNTFTPNGDGINDLFHLITYPDLGTFHIWIYNRWGDKMYESTDVGFQWNGTDESAGGKPLNTGVFVYVIEYTTFTSKGPQKIGGNISLVK